MAIDALLVEGVRPFGNILVIVVIFDPSLSES